MDMTSAAQSAIGNLELHFLKNAKRSRRGAQAIVITRSHTSPVEKVTNPISIIHSIEARGRLSNIFMILSFSQKLIPYILTPIP